MGPRQGQEGKGDVLESTWSQLLQPPRTGRGKYVSRPHGYGIMHIWIMQMLWILCGSGPPMLSAVERQAAIQNTICLWARAGVHDRFPPPSSSASSKEVEWEERGGEGRGGTHHNLAAPSRAVPSWV